ncbi:DUF6301 family protein [Nocardia sp. NPDC058176]|uniref:DUF6301 family protein n=1 Tax=Nocardia sp. NPDC058176 TaxID=3346368 RepID=UPI0036DD4C20
MDRRRALTDDGITVIATRLRALDGARPVDTLSELATEFGWRVISTYAEGALLDIGLGPASGRLFARDGLIVDITLWITKGVPRDSEGRSWTRDMFARTTAALSAIFGDPTERNPGQVASIRWAGPANTLVLRDVNGSLQLSLLDNTWLAEQDQATALDAQEQR